MMYPRFVPFITAAALTLASGCIADEFAEEGPNEQQPDGGIDADTDAQGDADADTDPCGGACDEEDGTVCDEESGECVGCVEDNDCDDGVCNPDANECVECLDAENDCDGEPYCSDDGKCVECLGDEDCDGYCSDDGKCVECLETYHCERPDASACNDDNECVGCEVGDQCAHLEGTPTCDTTGNSGECVECTVDTEEEFCGDYSCDPEKNECTDNERGDTGLCEECSADSECTGNLECVPAKFEGQELDKAYCLYRSQGECDNPPYFKEVSRTSLSRETEDTYCTIDEDLTTCEASKDLEAHQDCETLDDCGHRDLEDGRCFETDSGDSGVCTVPCEEHDFCSRGDCEEDDSNRGKVCIDDTFN